MNTNSNDKKFSIAEKQAFSRKWESSTLSDFVESERIQLWSIQDPVLRKAAKSSIDRNGGNHYPLFFTGVPSEGALEAVLGPKASWSSLMLDTEERPCNWFGTQGYSFSVPYMWDTTYSKYYGPVDKDFDFDYSTLGGFNSHGLMTESAVNAARTELFQYIGGQKLVPLSWNEAVEYVCSKPTSTWPANLKKNDPSIKQACLDFWRDLDGQPVRSSNHNSALAGQRYQRNKHFENGEFKPRGIFNADIIQVINGARFVVPFTRALQKVAFEQGVFSPFAELNGPYAVGQKFYEWNEMKPNMAPTTISVDVKGMDTSVTNKHGALIFQLIEPLFDLSAEENLRNDLAWSIQYCFESTLVLDADHVVMGTHSIFSGVVWTHLLESLLGWLAQRAGVATLFAVTGDKTMRYRAVSSWKTPFISVGGDDSATMLALPVNCKFYSALLKEEIDPVVHFAAWYAKFGLTVSLEKSDVTFNYVDYMSKVYSPNSVMVDGDMRVFGWRPVYYMAACVNGIYNPEHTTSSSVADEIARVAMIADQSYGHSKWNNLIDVLYRTIDTKKKEEVLNTLLNSEAINAAATFVERSWSFAECEWDAVSSPTILSLIARFTGSPAEAVNAASISGLVARLRCICWTLRCRLDETGRLDDKAVEVLSYLLTARDKSMQDYANIDHTLRNVYAIDRRSMADWSSALSYVEAQDVDVIVKSKGIGSAPAQDTLIPVADITSLI